MATRPMSSFEMLPLDKPSSEPKERPLRPCCVLKNKLKPSDMYILEGWERPKTGKVKEKYRNYRYEFNTNNFFHYEMSQKKHCCKTVEKQRKRDERVVDKCVERGKMKDTFFCECSHCTSFYKGVIKRHKIPYMEENRSSLKNVITTQRQYHTRKSWRDEYGVRKGDRVIVDGKLGGKAMYIGYLDDHLLAPELYVGVKLDEPLSGGQTGIFSGKFYFEAPPGFGMLVKYERIAKVKKFDPTEEGGPDKKVLKNQASLAWLYGQSLDEAEIREYALQRYKAGSPKPHQVRRTAEKMTAEQKGQREMRREWAEKHGEPHAARMWDNYLRLLQGYEAGLEEERIRREKEEAEELARQLEEQARLEAEQAANEEYSMSESQTTGEHNYSKSRNGSEDRGSSKSSHSPNETSTPRSSATNDEQRKKKLVKRAQKPKPKLGDTSSSSASSSENTSTSRSSANNTARLTPI